MLDFLYIILIFLEIAGLYFAIIKILEFDKKLQKYSETVIEKGKIIADTQLKIQNTARKINRVISFLKNENVWRAKRIITTAISVIEVIIILKSFKMKKGVKFNLKNLKKLLLTSLSREVIKKIFNGIALVC